MSMFAQNLLTGFIVGALIGGASFLGFLVLIAFVTWDPAPFAFISWFTFRLSIATGIGLGLWFAIDEAVQ